MKPLSERLEIVGTALTAAYAREGEKHLPDLPRDEIEEAIDLLREAAELARRVEAGPREKVTHWEQAAFAKAGVPIPDEGSYVRLVPEAGLGGGK